MIEKLKRLDWFLLGGLIFFAVMSLVTIFSSDQVYFWRQFVWYLLSFALIIFGSQFDWRWLIRQSWFRLGLYWLSVAFLIFSNFQAKTIRGTKSWIVVGNFQFEPAELAKLALIIILASFFARRHIGAWQIKNIFTSFVYMIVPTALVLIHPDLGSTITLVLIWLAFILMSGVNKKRLLIGVAFAIILMAVFWFFVLHPYQKDRVLGFLFPTRDPLGINYNVIQSKIAIGSAGFFGKGFGEGTQTKLYFLPAAKTDFLFAAFVEEWGLFGGLLLLLTFILIIYRLLMSGLRARDNYSKFIVLGTGAFLTIHFFINIGSNLGLLPVTGLTLPFFSYGGSNLLTTATLVSIMENIKIEF